MSAPVGLLPCPFCGESKYAEIMRTNYPGERRIVCNYQIGGCGTATASGQCDHSAIAAWNRRAAPVPPVAPADLTDEQKAAPELLLALIMVSDTIGFKFMEQQIQDLTISAIDKAAGSQA